MPPPPGCVLQMMCSHDNFTFAGSLQRCTPQERLQEARKIVGNRLLAEVAEHDAEAAFTLWMHDHPRSYSYGSQVCSAGPLDPNKCSGLGTPVS